MPRINASPALSHLRILDLTRVRAGPTCVRIFADFGADVIKVEMPPGTDAADIIGGPRDGFDMQNLHRNKRSMTLNLKSAKGVEIFKKLVATADIVVENYRPDVKARMGIGYDALKAVNKRIILASISGFGETGPYRMRPGLDQIAQGMGGLMWVTGKRGAGTRARWRGNRGFIVRKLRSDRYPDCAGGTRALGRRAVGDHLAAAGADRHDGFSGRALSRRWRGAATGGQRPSVCHADGCVRNHRMGLSTSRSARNSGGAFVVCLGSRSLRIIPTMCRRMRAIVIATDLTRSS